MNTHAHLLFFPRITRMDADRSKLGKNYAAGAAHFAVKNIRAHWRNLREKSGPIGVD
jgi:hypothetical protein